MNKAKTILAVLTVLAIAVPGTADAAKKRKAPANPPCVSEAAMPALNVYTLKTELMTAALSCGERERYNQFVGMREFELTQYGGQMKKALGGKTNHFVTEVANKTGGQLDCAEASAHFDRVLSPETELLDTIATTEWAQHRHGYQVCPVRVAKKGKK